MKMTVEMAKKSPIAEYLIKLRTARGWTQRDVAQKTSLGINTVSSHENGHTIPPMSTRRLYAEAYGIKSVAEFDDGWRPGGPETRRNQRITSRGSPSGMIPVINKAPAGPPRNYEECFTDSGVGFEYIDRGPGLPDGDLFAFVVVGDSMIPEYQPGDVVVCEWAELPELEEGEAVFIRLGVERDHECTFKRLFRGADGRLELRPDNRRHSVTMVRPEDVARLGGVVEVRRRTKRAISSRNTDDSTSQLVKDEHSQVGVDDD